MLLNKVTHKGIIHKQNIPYQTTISQSSSTVFQHILFLLLDYFISKLPANPNTKENTQTHAMTPYQALVNRGTDPDALYLTIFIILLLLVFFWNVVRCAHPRLGRWRHS